MSYRRKLERALAEVGIAGALRERILAEFDDHLECDPHAELGEPAELARRFADELGTRRALRAAFSAFAALGVVAILFQGAILAVPHAGGFSSLQRHGESALSLAGLTLSALGAQVALVAGGLAAVRAMRRRRSEVLAAQEAVVLVRRAGVGLGAGALTLVGLALTAAGTDGSIAKWWTVLAYCVCVAGTIALAPAVRALLWARALTPCREGSAGDLGDDLRGLVPTLLDAGSWSFALLVAGAVAIAIALAGALAQDPFDGIARGLADAAACLLCYAVLGRYLGLRQAPERSSSAG